MRTGARNSSDNASRRCGASSRIGSSDRHRREQLRHRGRNARTEGYDFENGSVPRSTNRCSRACRGTPLARAHLRQASGTVTRSVVASGSTPAPQISLLSNTAATDEALQCSSDAAPMRADFSRATENQGDSGVASLQYRPPREDERRIDDLENNATVYSSCDSLPGTHATLYPLMRQLYSGHDATLYPPVDGQGAKTCDSLPVHRSKPCDSLLSHATVYSAVYATVCYLMRQFTRRALQTCDTFPRGHATVCYLMRQFTRRSCDSLLSHATVYSAVMRQFAIHATLYSGGESPRKRPRESGPGSRTGGEYGGISGNVVSDLMTPLRDPTGSMHP